MYFKFQAEVNFSNDGSVPCNEIVSWIISDGQILSFSMFVCLFVVVIEIHSYYLEKKVVFV